jgi:NADH-quinone oxidoreductase subunit E
MRLTPAYLVAVASFYDMLDTQPVGHKRVYVCTNISCSLRGGRQLLAKLTEAVGDDPDVQVRGFECLGACDIAPMASINGVFVGPIEDGEIAELAQQVCDGADPLPAKQLLKRPSADPHANTRAPQESSE